MSLFKKYPSLTNASQTKFIDGVRLHVTDSEWIVTEKIHGANFQLIFDENNKLTFGSRNQHLDEFSSFYDLPGLIRVENNGKTLIQRATELNDHIRKYWGRNITQVNLFGEYAGTLTQGNKVQREVEYGSQEFYLFDIVFTVGEESFYINKLTVRELAKQFGLAQPALILITDNLDDALQVPNDFDSVSSQYRYTYEEQIPESEIQFTGKNITEGVVIEPVNPTFWKNSRVIIKNKNSKFSENHQSKPMKKEVILSDEENQLLHIILGYVNTNRVSNVCSHYGISTRKELSEKFGIIIKDTLQDVILDLEKDEIDLSLLDKVIKLVNRSVAQSVREFLQTLE